MELVQAYDTLTLAWFAAAFVAAGLVKGIAAFGLPLIAIPLLSVVVPVPQALALTIVPIFASNLLLMFQDREEWRVVLRVWPLYAGLMVGLAIGLRIMGGADPGALLMAVGAMLLLFVATRVFRIRLAVRESRERGLFVGTGLVGGLFGGITAIYAFPTIPVLMSLELGRARFAFAVTTMFVCGTLVMAPGLTMLGAMGQAEWIASALALVPIAVGQSVGRLLRDRIDETWFQRFLLVLLCLMGLSQIARGAASALAM